MVLIDPSHPTLSIPLPSLAPVAAKCSESVTLTFAAFSEAIAGRGGDGDGEILSRGGS